MAVKIIMAVCYLPCMLILFGFMYLEGKQKGNILLGVTLWQGAEQEPAVEQVRKRFRKEMIGLLLISIFSFVLINLPSRESIVLSLQFLWLLFVIAAFFFPVAWGNGRLKTLKREWRAKQAIICKEEVQQAVPDDAAPGEELEAAAPEEKPEERQQLGDGGRLSGEAAIQSGQKPFLKLSLAGVLCGVIPVIAELFLAKHSFYGWWVELFLIMMLFAGGACFWAQYYFWQLQTDVLSFKSEVNILLARVRQYQWSRLFCILIWCNTILTVLLWWGLYKPKLTFYVIFGGIVCYLGIITVAAFAAERKVRSAYNSCMTEASVQEDEDDYWIWGILYYNKKDKRFLVNKRVGIGTTVNMAKPSGKLFTIGVGVVTLGMLIWAAGWILMDDFVPISLAVEEGAVVSSQYKEEYQISLDEIKEAELIEELPDMSKRVGSAMDTMMKGSFLDAEYQSCKVCVRRQRPPFLKLVTKDGMIYYLNDEEPKVTKEIYQQLQSE